MHKDRISKKISQEESVDQCEQNFIFFIYD